MRSGVRRHPAVAVAVAVAAVVAVVEKGDAP
jgi:hypothetical protein